MWCSLYLVKGGAALPSIDYKSIVIYVHMLRIIGAGRQWLCCDVFILDCIDLTETVCVCVCVSMCVCVCVCNIRGRRKIALGKHNTLESSYKTDRSVWTEVIIEKCSDRSEELRKINDRNVHNRRNNILYSLINLFLYI